MLNKDHSAKQARGYTDPKSKVFNDGREILHNKDWDRRKQELWDRAEGRCEFIFPTTWNTRGRSTRCGREGVIPSHIEPRYPVRDDRLTNLKLHCFQHDRDTEKQSWRKLRWKEGVTPNNETIAAAITGEE